MKRIQLDSETIAIFQKLTEGASIIDEDGILIGYFQPAGLGNAVSSKDSSPFTDEEMRKRFKDREGARPLSEVLRDLGAI